MVIEPPVQVEPVTHRELTDEDVELALVRHVVEEQPLGPVQRVEPRVRGVAELPQRPRGGPAGLA